MIRAIASSTILMSLLAIMQSRIFQGIAIFGVIPDISLVVLVYCAIKNGSMEGQVSGFLSGITFDVISSAPLGFNVLVRTLLGFLYGIFQGKLFIDILIGPFLLAFTATLLKIGMGTLLGLIFPGSMASIAVIGRVVFIEALYNAIIAPPVFLLLNLLKKLFVTENRGGR
jgi:rod shape-determining protein MreD